MRNDKPFLAVYSAKVETDANALLVHAWKVGYDDEWQCVSIGKETEVEVPKIEMRKMREFCLNEVVVKATHPTSETHPYCPAQIDI